MIFLNKKAVRIKNSIICSIFEFLNNLSIIKINIEYKSRDIFKKMNIRFKIN